MLALALLFPGDVSFLLAVYFLSLWCFLLHSRIFFPSCFFVQLAEVYRKAWNSVEVAGLEMLIAQLSASEERLLEFLDKAKREVGQHELGRTDS